MHQAGDTAAPPAPGRRHLTLLFADLSGSTRLGRLLEVEEYGQLLAGFRDLCKVVIPAHGGHIARIQGDGALAVFGLPQVREDDGRRATEAALDLHQRLTRLSPQLAPGLDEELTLHSGIHAGTVFVGEGDVELGRFELLGDAPNVAAMLSKLAARDEILVSEQTLGRQARFFHTDPPRAIAVKDGAATLQVLRVLGRVPAEQVSSMPALRPRMPLAGRTEPLRQLRREARLAEAGAARCALLVGEPGLGKTRLAEELLRYEELLPFRVLRGYCDDPRSAEPLQPFRQLLRALDPDDAAEATAATARERLAALAAAGPLALVLDDWQWADDLSRQVLDALLALPHPLFVLLTSRVDLADSLARPATLDLRLHALDGADAARVVAHLLPDADPFLAEHIHRHAGGIPLFIEELCHLGTGRASQDQGESAGDSPAWLGALVASRVARLPEDCAQLLRTAAVIGNAVPHWLLARTAGHAGLDARLAVLADADFLYPDVQAGMLRFKHGITRDAVYRSVGLSERRATHRAVAAALEARGAEAGDEGLHEALAYHHAAGGAPGPAAQHAEAAGDRALAALALDRARSQFVACLAALDALGTPDAVAPRWCAVAQKLGMAAVFDPLALSAGVDLFERGVDMARRTGQAGALARAEYWLGYVCYARGLSRRAQTHCRAALQVGEQAGDPRLVAQVQATLGQTYLLSADYDRALPLLDAGLEGKRRQARPGGGLAVGYAYTLSCKGFLLADQGHFGDADACFEEALELLGDSMHQVGASARGWMSLARQWQGRWQEALDAARAAAAIAAHVKSRQLLAVGRSFAGYARWMLTGQADALEDLREGTAWIESSGGRLAASLNHGWMVDGALAVDATAEARRHAALLFRRAREHDRVGEALGCRALARAAARSGDRQHAPHYLERARRAAAFRGAPHEDAGNLLCAAQVALALEDRPGARTAADQALARFERMDMRWHAARALQLLQAC